MDLNTQKCRKFFFWHEQDDINLGQWQDQCPSIKQIKINIANQSAHLQNSFSTYEYNFLIMD